MHPVIQALHEDHINVARLLDLLERIFDSVDRADLSDLPLAQQAMRYMTAYPDIYHHPAEEVVFAALVSRAPETKAIVEQLSAEHGVLGTTGASLVSLLELGVKTDTSELLAVGSQYLTTLRDHMNLEEGKVFPIVKVVFRPSDWDNLTEQLELGRDPLFGPQLKSSYRALARTLTTR